MATKYLFRLGFIVWPASVNKLRTTFLQCVSTQPRGTVTCMPVTTNFLAAATLLNITSVIPSVVIHLDMGSAFRTVRRKQHCGHIWQMCVQAEWGSLLLRVPSSRMQRLMPSFAMHWNPLADVTGRTCSLVFEKKSLLKAWLSLVITFYSKLHLLYMYMQVLENVCGPWSWPLKWCC